MKQISTFSEATESVQEDSLVVLDFDDTTGRIKIFFSSQRDLESWVKDFCDSDDKKLNEHHYRVIRHYKNHHIEPHLEFTHVDPKLVETLSAWKEKGAKFIILTARPPERADATEKALKDLNVFDFLLKTGEHKIDSLNEPILVKNGVIYANHNNPKAQALSAASDILIQSNGGKTFSNILVFDDSQKYLDTFKGFNLVSLLKLVGNCASKLCQILTHHFLGTTSFYNSFVQGVARVQESHFYENGIIISNEKARELWDKMTKDRQTTFTKEVLEERNRRIDQFSTSDHCKVKLVMAH